MKTLHIDANKSRCLARAEERYQQHTAMPSDVQNSSTNLIIELRDDTSCVNYRVDFLPKRNRGVCMRRVAVPIVVIGEQHQQKKKNFNIS